MSNKPVEIELLLRETVTKGMKEIIDAIKGLDTGVKASSVNMKEQISQQRQLIREITGDIRNLTAAAKEATNPGQKAEILGNLRGAKRALAEEQAAMIGLQRQQIEGNTKEAESHGGIIAGLGKWVLGLASVAAVMKAGKSIIESTEAGAKNFEFAIAGAENGLSYFWKTLATGDFSNFFDNMGKAIKAGHDFAEAMHEVKEGGWAQSMKEADMLKPNTQLEIDLRNTSLPKDVRLAKGEERVKNEEELSKGRIKNAEAELTAMVGIAEERSRIDAVAFDATKRETYGQNQLLNILKQVDETTKIKAEEFNKTIKAKQKEYTRMASYISTEDAEKKVGKDVAPEVKLYAESLRQKGKLTEEMILGVVNAYKKVGEADNSSLSGLKRVMTTINGIKKSFEDEDIAAAKKLKEAEGLENRIKAVRDLMDETKDANSAEFAALAKKLVMLEAEKKLRQSMVDMQMMIAKNQPIDSKGAASPISAIYAMAKAGGIDLENIKLKDTDLEVNKLKKGNEERIRQAEKLGKLSIKEVKDSEKLSTQFFDAADAAAYLSEVIGNSNQGLSDMLSGVGKVAGQIGNLVKSGAFAKDGKGMKPGEAVSAIIGGASQLIGLVVGAAAERKRVMDEYYASIISQQQEYNLLLNDQLRLNSDINGSVFLKDYAGTLEDSTKAYNDAQRKYNETLKQFATSEAITGKKNVISSGNVLAGVGAGAAMGAGIGSIVPVIGTVIGAATGAIIGGLTGLFAKKKKDVVAPLLETYKDLITPAGEFDEILAKTLITNNLVTEATKATLQKLIDWKEAAAKAREQLSNVIKDLAGTMGDDLRNALVTAFKDGTDASIAFGDSVNKVWENIMSNMIFNKVFEGAFQQLEDGMNASYGIGKDGKPITGAVVDNTWIDDFKKFMDQKGVLTDQFNKEMANAKQAGADAGFNIFNNDAANAQSSGMRGDIQRMTEETGSALGGNISAIRINMARLIQSGNTSMSMLQKSLEYQLRTADNTGEMNKTLTEMKGQLTRFELDGIKVK